MARICLRQKTPVVAGYAAQQAICRNSRIGGGARAGAVGLSRLRYGVEFGLLPGQAGEVDFVLGAKTILGSLRQTRKQKSALAFNSRIGGRHERHIGKRYPEKLDARVL